MEQNLLRSLTIHQLINKFSAVYDTWMFIAVFNTAYSLESDGARQCLAIQFCDIHFNTILPSMPGSSKWSPSVTVPHQALHTLLFSQFIPYVPISLIPLHLITLMYGENAASTHLFQLLLFMEFILWYKMISRQNQNYPTNKCVHSVYILQNCLQITVCWDVTLCSVIRGAFNNLSTWVRKKWLITKKYFLFFNVVP